jgi:hypothetical protein
MGVHKQSVKRQRGVILSDRGFAKIQDARQKLEEKENYGDRFTVEVLSELTGLDPHTLGRIYNREVRVDKQTLHRYFSAFNLTLDKDDYLKPQLDKGQLISQSDTNLIKDLNTFQTYNQWAEVPGIINFCGRTIELKTLQQWILAEKCRFVLISGQAGIGKTCLAVKLVENIQSEFEFVIWRSLFHIPPLQDFLGQLLQVFLPESESHLSNQIQDKLILLIQHLRKFRCLLVIDGVEKILNTVIYQSPQTYQNDWISPENSSICAEYQWLLKQLGIVNHQSCVMLTTRYELPDMKYTIGPSLPMRELRLQGLSLDQGQQLLTPRGQFQATDNDWTELLEYYGGHPLFLTIAARTIQKLFAENVTHFLQSRVRIYGDIRKHLNEQCAGLSAPQWQLLHHLAQAREGLVLEDLFDLTQAGLPLESVIEILDELEGRSLVVKKGSDFYLEPVVRDYVLSQDHGVDNSLIERWNVFREYS